MRGNSRVEDVTVAWDSNDEKDGSRDVTVAWDINDEEDGSRDVTVSQTVDQTKPGARGQGELTLQSSAFRYAELVLKLSGCLVDLHCTYTVLVLKLSGCLVDLHCTGRRRALWTVYAALAQACLWYATLNRFTFTHIPVRFGPEYLSYVVFASWYFLASVAHGCTLLVLSRHWPRICAVFNTKLLHKVRYPDWKKTHAACIVLSVLATAASLGQGLLSATSTYHRAIAECHCYYIHSLGPDNFLFYVFGVVASYAGVLCLSGSLGMLTFYVVACWVTSQCFARCERDLSERVAAKERAAQPSDGQDTQPAESGRSDSDSDDLASAVQEAWLLHRDCCLLMAEVNTGVTHIVLLSLTYCTCYVCFILYVVTHGQHLGEFGIIASVGMLLCFMGIMGMCLGGSRINTKAHSPLGALHAIDLATVNTKTQLMVISFVSKLNGPDLGISPLNLFTLTSPSVTTVLMTLLSYAVVVFQFQ